MKRLLNLFFCLSAVMMLSAPQFAAAQTAEVTVSGKVSDQNGLPIIGAGVVLSSDSSKGTTTDLDGNYTITVPANSTLNFSCIGYGDEAVSVNGRSRIDVVLSEDNEFIEETIVIGYGVQRKSDITGSVASVRSSELSNRSTSDAAAALQGKAAGVQIVNSSGAPGEAAKIRVRGYSSNSGNIGPLLIVDGLKVDNIQYLDPSMIQNIEITKRGEGNIALEMKVTGTKGEHTVKTENKIRSALGGSGYEITKQDGTVTESQPLLPSAFFTIEKSGDVFVLHGGGYGHGIGMSQNGAKVLALKGYSYQAILSYYYTGVEIA